MTYFNAVERTNRPQNYHKFPFVMIVMILTTSSLSHSRKFYSIQIQGNFLSGFNIEQIFGKFVTFG